MVIHCAAAEHGGLITSSSDIAETALQSALVLAKSGRLELADNILRTL